MRGNLATAEATQQQLQLQVTHHEFCAHTEWVNLNVGGKLFATTISTLTRTDGNSMLARMFTHGDVEWQSSVDETGAYLIDRSPLYFEPILNYLRHGQLILDKAVNAKGVLEEAKFFGLTSLIEQLEDVIEREQPADDTTPITRRELVMALMVTPTNKELRWVNFTGANLSKLDLRYINFKYAILRKANLSGANLSYCNFERADLCGATVDSANLLGVKALCANMEGTSLRSCNFEDPAGSRANMEDDFLSKESFDAIQNFIITKPELQSRLVTVEEFNTASYGPVVKKLAAYMIQLELENEFLSNEEKEPHILAFLSNEERNPTSCLLATNHALPNFRDVFMLYCSLTPGTTVKDICARFNPHTLKVDER
nr:hypothetical protein BaRGS_025829 [Batillaria attramentaria]